MSFSQRQAYVMRVYDVNLTSTSVAGSGRAQDTQKAGQAGNSPAGGAGTAATGDHVEFSSTLGRISQALAADGSGRASQVQALAAQYQSGRYQPDSLAISRGMISEALAANAK